MSEQGQTIWELLVAGKELWIGSWLEDTDACFGAKPARTTITDMTLVPNGPGQFFTVHGKKFDCGFDTRYGGIGGGDAESMKLYGIDGIRGLAFTITRKKRR